MISPTPTYDQLYPTSLCDNRVQLDNESKRTKKDTTTGPLSTQYAETGFMQRKHQPSDFIYPRNNELDANEPKRPSDKHILSILDDKYEDIYFTAYSNDGREISNDIEGPYEDVMQCNNSSNSDSTSSNHALYNTSGSDVSDNGDDFETVDDIHAMEVSSADTNGSTDLQSDDDLSETSNNAVQRSLRRPPTPSLF